MIFKADKEKFEKEILGRGITQLVHFTKTDNLLGIFGRKKLIPRTEIDKIRGPEGHNREGVWGVRDSIRLDGKLEYISLSIQHPNYYMFGRKQNEELSQIVMDGQNFRFVNEGKKKGDGWCVILINPKYIYCENTLFSISNAASNFSQESGIGGSLEHFQKLFQDNICRPRWPLFTRTGLLPCYTTDIQAEVLVKDEISCDDFIKVCFYDEQNKENTAEIIRNELFRARRINVDSWLRLFEVDTKFWNEQRV